MRTHADRSPLAGPAAAQARRAPAASPGADLAADPAAPLSPDGLRRLGAAAGNRATAGLVAQRTGPAGPPVVQRAVSLAQAAQLAALIHDAIDGLGTDEEAVYGALSGRTPEDIDAIRDAYFLAYDETLQHAINDDFSGDELDRVNRLLEGHAAPGPISTDAQQAAAVAARAREIAASLREAMRGAGTEEDEIFNALEGRSTDEIGAIKREYLALTDNTLEEDLVDDLSGDELQRALDLLGVRSTGEFTNRVTQEMTEQMTTVVRGRFTWSLTDDRLEIDVPARFVPAPGIAVPLATWQTEIDGIWNQFAVTEPGGQRVEIHMTLRDDPGDPRRIDVVQNQTPGTYGGEDRANAGMFYPVMNAGIAAHEFGHLVGLPDEYQRTHRDFTAITGENRVGPANASGKTPLVIARELHDALYLEDATQRAPRATTVLRNVGLISGGTPQQGDFAQSVMAAYDDEYGGVFSSELLEVLVDRLPEGSRWTIQTVFSYASGTIMGNKGEVGVQAHEHPVMPRHMREFKNIVARRFPEKTWTLGPR